MLYQPAERSTAQRALSQKFVDEDPAPDTFAVVLSIAVVQARGPRLAQPPMAAVLATP